MKISKPQLTITLINDCSIDVIVEEYSIENRILIYRNYHDRKLVYHNYNDIRFMTVDYVGVEKYIPTGNKIKLDNLEIAKRISIGIN